MSETRTDDPYRQMLNDRELTELQQTGKLRTLGGLALAALVYVIVEAVR